MNNSVKAKIIVFLTFFIFWMCYYFEVTYFPLKYDFDKMTLCDLSSIKVGDRDNSISYIIFLLQWSISGLLLIYLGYLTTIIKPKNWNILSLTFPLLGITFMSVIIPSEKYKFIHETGSGIMAFLFLFSLILIYYKRNNLIIAILILTVLTTAISYYIYIYTQLQNFYSIFTASIKIMIFIFSFSLLLTIVNGYWDDNNNVDIKYYKLEDEKPKRKY